MRKLTLSIVSLLIGGTLLMLTINSCQKKEISQQKQEPISMLQAFHWYNNNLLSEPSFRKNIDARIADVVSVADTSGFIGFPDWNQNYTIPFTDGGGIIKVVLTNYYIAF